MLSNDIHNIVQHLEQATADVQHSVRATILPYRKLAFTQQRHKRSVSWQYADLSVMGGSYDCGCVAFED
jgi:hypothetical protein